MKDNDNKYFELEPVLDYIGPKGKWLMFQNVCLFFFGLASGLAGVSYSSVLNYSTCSDWVFSKKIPPYMPY